MPGKKKYGDELDKKCPRCDAPAGKRCKGPKGKPLSAPHVARKG